MTSLNVMVVDDSGLTAKKVSKMLEDLGHHVVKVCKTGREAIDGYRQANPDLVTMDITMPDMNGIEATEKIKAQFQDAIIIMVTSHGQKQMVMDAIAAGAMGYVLKPVKKDKLQESIDRVVAKST